MNYPTDELMNKALSYYTDHRGKYHTKWHVLEMLTAMDCVFMEDDDRDDLMIGPATWSRHDRMLLRTAALFHDADYTPGYQDNEGKAVDIAAYEMRRRGWVEKDIERLRFLILSTTPFKLDMYVDECPELRNHMYLLHDLDWIGFMDWDVMKANEYKIIEEFASSQTPRLPYENVLEGQMAFYKKILELREDKDSVIGKGFYRYWKYIECSEDALRNIEDRVDEFDLDKELDALMKKCKEESEKLQENLNADA